MLILFSDHPDRDTLFFDYHPHSKIVTRDDYPEGGFVEVLYPFSEQVFNHQTASSLHHYDLEGDHNKNTDASKSEIEEFVPAEGHRHHRKRHRRLHNETGKIPAELQQNLRFKRHQSNGHVNYCCRNPDGKVCRKLICGHYGP